MEENVDKNNVITRSNLGVVQTSADEMDVRRRNTAVLDYLCKLDEAKEWVLGHVNKQVDLQTFLEELPKGEWLAEIVLMFDKSTRQRIYRSQRREYLHTDNINLFLSWIKKIRISRHFLFDVIDLYESKNIPKVVYAIHGLAHFLSARGITMGISKRSHSVFTKEEEDLIADDIKNIVQHKYDDIQNNLESDEYVSENSRSRGLGDGNTSVDQPDFLVCESHPENEEIERDLKTFEKTYLWRKAFNSILGSGRLSLNILRKFVSPNFQSNIKYNQLHKIQQEIIERFKANHRLQWEKDSIIRTARLLVENQARLRNIPFEEFPLANDYRYFKMTLYSLIHDPNLIYKIIHNGCDLPLRTIFADSTVGDFFFSKFVEKHVASKRHEMFKIAAKHFLTSKVFANIISLFDSQDAFDLNPVAVSESLYNKLPEVDPLNKYSKKAMLDEAIKDKCVRDEIVRRASKIIDYIAPRIRYIRSIELPYYVKIFVKDPMFFEQFIEPAIILSKNFIICEIFKYIFYNKSLFETQTRSFEQERLYYYECKFDKTTSLDFSDYSPLRDFLESEENNRFFEDFTSRNKSSTVTEYFAGVVSDSECLQVEISLEEVNYIIIILKKNIKYMTENLKSIVNEMSLLGERPEQSECEVLRSDLSRCSQTVDLIVEGQSLARENPDHSTKSDVEFTDVNSEKKSSARIEENLCADTKIYPESAKSDIHSLNKNKDASVGCAEPRKENLERYSERYKSERFILKLDTQFVELPDSAEMALESLIKDLKSRVVLMISISQRQDFIQILYSSTHEEYESFETSKPVESADLDTFKKQIVDDLEFLESKSVVSKANGYMEILEQIVSDILDHKFNLEDDQLEMNSETLDALFKKGVSLKDEVKSLHLYLKALCESMTVNKSGSIFNRQYGQGSKYGTYKYKISDLNPRAYENVSLENLYFIISMRESMVIDIEICCDNISLLNLTNIRFDELLRLSEDGIKYFEAGDLCAISVGCVVDLVNRQYVRY